LLALLLKEEGERVSKINIGISRHVFPVEPFHLLIFLDPGTTDMQMSRDKGRVRRRAYSSHYLPLVDDGGTTQISTGLDVAINRIENSVSLPDLRMSNIEGFSQKITMKMNQLSWKEGRDQHLRQDILYSRLHILHEIKINTFMGMRPPVF